jgi:hypothetical protein
MDHAERDRAFAELLSGVIERHAVASRLKSTVALAEQTLTMALRVGDGVRRALRNGTADRPNEDDCRQLEDLATRLEAATDEALVARTAQALREAAAAGRTTEAAQLAAQLFAGLVRPAALPLFVYVGLTARRRARSGETLVHPAALAEEIAARNRDGLGPASGITPAEEGPVLPEPIALAASFDSSASEIALRRPTLELADGLLEDTASGDLLVFSARIAGPFTVLLAREADDEWWAASSTPYASYCAELVSALTRLGIAAETAA